MAKLADKGKKRKTQDSKKSSKKKKGKKAKAASSSEDTSSDSSSSGTESLAPVGNFIYRTVRRSLRTSSRWQIRRD